MASFGKRSGNGKHYTYVHLSDLRGSDGYATIKEHFVGTGNSYYFMCQYNPEDAVSAKIDGVELSPSEYLYGDYRFMIASVVPPRKGADIEFVYKTSSDSAKAFTLGVRDLNSDVGGYSYALGLLTDSSGFCSYSEGKQTIASGVISHAEGDRAKASGNYSHAEGSSTTASGACSHAEGSSTTASGEYSHSEGRSSVASGMYSHAQNWGTKAQRYGQTVIGTWNVPDTQGADTTQRGKYALIIGNGTNNGYFSNALTVEWNGNVWCDGDITDGHGNTLSDKIEASDIPTNVSAFTNDSGYLTSETDPTVPSWAKASTKPSYTASEISGLMDFFYPVGSYYETSDADFDPNTAWGGTWELEESGRVHVSAGTGYTLGDKGGSKDAIVPYHNHGFTNPTISEKAADTSGTPSNNTSGTPSSDKSGTPSTNTSGAMSANSSFSGTFDLRRWGTTTGSIVVANSGIVTQSNVSTTAHGVQSSGGNNGTVQRITISKDISHTHTLSNHTHSLSSHTHTLSSHTHSIPKHSHTASGGKVGYAGTNGNATNANMQPYIVVNRWHRTA